MKKRKKWYRILSFVLTVAMLAGFCPQGVSFKGMPVDDTESRGGRCYK